MVKVNGYFVQAYLVCPREVWFFSREVVPYQEDDLLELGRLIHEGSYKREKKEIEFGEFKIDLMKKGKSGLIIAEVKKSSRAIKPAKMQLLFYLYKLKQMGIVAEGELLIPKERKREKVILTGEMEKEVENIISEIRNIIRSDKMPEFKKIPFCKKCAYRDFCLA